jgi:hypothetical protein
MDDIESNIPGTMFRRRGQGPQPRESTATLTASPRQHPDQVREAARYATYPNSAAEKQALTSIDQQVFARVREHENQLADTAERAAAKYEADTEAATELVDRFALEIRVALTEGTPNREIAARFKQLRLFADKAMAALDRGAEEAEFYAVKLEHPYEDLMQLYQKYPMIIPSIG